MIREQLEEYKRSAQEKFQIEVDKSQERFHAGGSGKVQIQPLLLDAEGTSTKP